MYFKADSFLHSVPVTGLISLSTPRKARGGANAYTLFAANITPPSTPLRHLPFPLLSDVEEGDF